ncbi:DUF3077 domain-containing protein [Pseudomonas typographi]|uniref:DUF3077 domain-containing protein n=1 Tax=Pseudomonas typographi TaxID=2715964 RepID=A0ABR7YXH0_9PSED|nr:DUF3077 domain-containing protein [Pseudomonas typographi]MBD1551005.1 DUF3077 domain-containing protein [Pseudomonas typographi]MBD1587919.1 DUF3077 domain-containing protein [Pseudomonas typographi]MBD1597904.1 DUF3077 domain-containing protein [Pseudomonas typographi]MBD1597907.1 DUF3077 domain-containing protein [Pseudomonas typographi]
MSTRLVTTENDFCPVGPVDKRLNLFKVTDGIDAEQALEKVSALLKVIAGSIEDAAMGTIEFDGQHAWLALHAAESAKAIIDALWYALQFDARESGQ